MIARIHGTVIEREEHALIVEAGGVGYRVIVGPRIREKVGTNDSATLRIYHHITDSGQELYGFEDEREEEYFRLLLNVPSIGARMARTILDTAPPDTLAQAVGSDDAAVLTRVPGVGKRTAERLLLELKGKMDALPQPATDEGAPRAVQQEAVEALVSIGYSQSQASKAVRELPAGIESVEEAVKAALQKQEA